MNNKTESTDPDIAATLRALRRAAKRAMRLAKATRTPFGVMKNGRMVNLNPNAKGGRKVRPATAKQGKRGEGIGNPRQEDQEARSQEGS